MLAVAAAVAASDCVEVHNFLGSKPPNLVGDPEQLPCEHVLLWNSSSLQDLLSRLQADRAFDCSKPSSVLSHSAMEHVVQPLLHALQDGSCVLDVGSGMNLSGLLATRKSLSGTSQNTPVADFDFIGVDSARCWTDVVVVVSGTHSRATCIPVTMGTFRDEHDASASLLATLKPTSAAAAASSAADGPGSEPTCTPAFVQCDERKLEVRLVRVQPPSLGRFSQPGRAAAALLAPVPPALAAASLPDPKTPAEVSSQPPAAPLPPVQGPPVPVLAPAPAPAHAHTPARASAPGPSSVPVVAAAHAPAPAHAAAPISTPPATRTVTLHRCRYSMLPDVCDTRGAQGRTELHRCR
jgi:hypothetical protein